MNAIRLPILTLLAASAALSAPLAAQGNRFVPADAQVVFRMAAPAKWKKDFANTKLAMALGGESLASIFGQLQQGLDQGLEQLKSSGKINPALVDGLLDDYQGDIVIGLRIDIEDLPAAMADEREPAMAVTFALTPDGEYPLADLVQAISQLIEEDAPGDMLRDVNVGERTLRCIVDSDGTGMVPSLIDGHLVTMFTTDMERFGTHMLDTADRHEKTGAGKAMHLQVGAEQAITALLDFAQGQLENDPSAPPIDLIQMMTDLGVSSVQNMSFSLHSEGEHAILETNLGCGGADRGLLGAFMFDHGAPKLLRYVPAASEAFACMPFDTSAVLNTVERVWSGLEGLVPVTFEDVEAMFAESAKVRLREDLIDHIGTEVLYVSDPEAMTEMDPDDPSAMFSGTCYALSLRDGQAFGESLEKALRSRGLHAARKSEDYQGTKVHLLRLGLFELEYAVTNDMLLLAPGSPEFSGRPLRAILDAQGSSEAGLPDNVTRHLEGVAAGWNGISVSPLATMLGQMSQVMEQMPAEMPPEMGMVFGMLGSLGQEMKRVGLEHAVQISWSSAKGARQVMRL